MNLRNFINQLSNCGLNGDCEVFIDGYEDFSLNIDSNTLYVVVGPVAEEPAVSSAMIAGGEVTTGLNLLGESSS